MAPIIFKIACILGALLEQKKYSIVAGDVGFILKSDSSSGTIRSADLAVTAREVIGESLPVGYSAQAPLLAIEVVSPGNRAADLELKVDQYLRACTQEVWLLYPDTRRIYVYVSGNRAAKSFTSGENFESILGCEFEVDPFFEI